MTKTPKDQRLDPDPFTIIGLAIGTVTGMAQIVQTYAQMRQAGMTGPGPMRPTQALRELRDALRDAVLHTEDIVRFLTDDSVLKARFEFASSSTLLTRDELQAYRGLVSHLALDVSKVTTWTLSLVEQAPDFVQRIATDISRDHKDISRRINRLYTAGLSNEQVLEECLMMLRSFHSLLSIIERDKN